MSRYCYVSILDTSRLNVSLSLEEDVLHWVAKYARGFEDLWIAEEEILMNVYSTN